MAEKLESNDVTLRPDGTEALVDGATLEPPHAAVRTAIAPTHAIMVSDLSSRNCVSPPDDLVLLGTIILGARVWNPQAGSAFSRKF